MSRRLMYVALGLCLATLAKAGFTPLEFEANGRTWTAVAKVTLEKTDHGDPYKGAFRVNLVEGSLVGSIYEQMAAPAQGLFETWCIESTRSFEFGTEYYATINPLAFWGGRTGGPGDPVSDVSEWIYDRWLSGTTNWSREEVRQSLWYAEGEIFRETDIYREALQALGHPWHYDAPDLGTAKHTYALNLWTLDDRYRSLQVIDVQSQLITMRWVVPVPGALGIGCFGMMITAKLRRKRSI